MSTRKKSDVQTSSKPRSVTQTEIVVPDEVITPRVKTVVGRRLVDKKEQFVIVDESDASNRNNTLSEGVEDSEKCPHCKHEFTSEEWDDAEGSCPNSECPGNVVAAPPLSEAEMIRLDIMQRQSDEYSLRVDRLVSYEKDGRTDSRAEKIFCTTLRPVSLDYLDVVRRAYGGGHFWFAMYKRGQGLVTSWYEGIEKPLVPEAPQPPTMPVPAAVAPTEHPFDIIISQANKVNDLKRALVGNELQELKELLATKTLPATENPIGKIDNPFALFAPHLATNPTLAEKLLERAFPEEREEKSSWLGDLLQHPQEAVQLIATTISLVHTTFFARGNAAAGSGPTPPIQPAAQAPLPGPTSDDEAIMVIVYALIDDIQHDRRTGRVADMIEEVSRKFPSAAVKLSQLLSATTPQIFSEIEHATKVDLFTYANAEAFIDDLKVDEELQEALAFTIAAKTEPSAEEGQPNVFGNTETITKPVVATAN